MIAAAHTPRVATIRKVVTVTGPLLAIMSVMLLVSVVSVDALSSLRAYVNGESLWSKAEHEASDALRSYASSGNPADYAEFEQALAIPVADSQARTELERALADRARAEQLLIAGGNARSDVAGMAVLFRVGRHLAAFATPVTFWRTADGLIQDLRRTGEELRAERSKPSPDERRINALVAGAEQVRRRLRPLEKGFSASLGELSRDLEHQLIVILAMLSGTLVAIGGAMLTSALRRTERVRGELDEARRLVQQEQERAQVTLGSIADAVITLHADKRVAYMNPAAERLLLCRREQAVGRFVGDVLRLAAEAESASIIGRLGKVTAGEELNGGPGGVPVHRRDGSEIAIHERAAPIHDSDGKVSGIVLVLRDVTEERRLSQRLNYQATHDALTGLANRYQFEAKLAAALEEHKRSGARFALLYFDLDQFKVINDTCGHSAGDELIRRVAFLVRLQLLGEDVLGRLGGDEFGALVTCGAEEALRLAERIRAEIAGLRFFWAGKLFTASVSIGVLGLTGELVNVAEALAAVDQACYLAKDGGRNRVQLYSSRTSGAAARRGAQMGRAHPCGVRTRTFAAGAGDPAVPPHHDPGKPRAVPRFEILLRLVEADGKPFAPMAFIPAAERLASCREIDRWVIAQACRELARCGQRRRAAAHLHGQHIRSFGVRSASGRLHRGLPGAVQPPRERTSVSSSPKPPPSPISPGFAADDAAAKCHGLSGGAR